MKKSEDLNDILEKGRVYPVFQPIISLKNGDLLGYEALSRIQDVQSIQNSEELFTLGVMYRKTWELEKMCRKKILHKYAEFKDKQKNGKLFINVNPLVMLDEHFKSDFTKKQLAKIDISSEKIVIEITERNTINNIEDFHQTVRHYKDEGYQLAIDDVGSCYSGLTVVYRTNPHYLKIDIELIRGIDSDSMKQALVMGLVEVAKNSSIELIAEGIETAAELDTVMKLGVNYGQGYFIAKPSEKLEKPSKASLLQIYKSIVKKNAGLESDEYRALYVTIKSYKDFEAYAVKYGDKKADEMLAIIRKIIQSVLLEDEAAYTIDEITSLVVIRKARLDCVGDDICQTFRSKLSNFYDSEDLENNYIDYVSHKGNLKQRDLMALRIDEITK